MDNTPTYEKDGKIVSSPIKGLTSNECIICRSTINVSKCSRCKLAHYCGPKCQKVHWKQGHRLICAVPVPASNSPQDLMKISKMTETFLDTKYSTRIKNLKKLYSESNHPLILDKLARAYSERAQSNEEKPDDLDNALALSRQAVAMHLNDEVFWPYGLEGKIHSTLTDAAGNHAVRLHQQKFPTSESIAADLTGFAKILPYLDESCCAYERIPKDEVSKYDRTRQCLRKIDHAGVSLHLLQADPENTEEWLRIKATACEALQISKGNSIDATTKSANLNYMFENLCLCFTVLEQLGYCSKDELAYAKSEAKRQKRRGSK